MGDWNIDFLEREEVVRLTANGSVDLPDIEQMGAELFSAAALRGSSKMLVDHREMTPEVSTVDIYDLPDVLEKLGFARSSKMAILLVAGALKRADYDFFETVSINRGFQVRLFLDPDEALGWLRAE